jgi:hypothetical protein
MEPYSGSPGTITTPLSVAISGTSNATPIVVTTVSNHGFGSGDSVHIAGVLGNLASNGDWTITVITANSFSLTASTGSGVYTSGSTATDYSLTPQISLFVDGTDGIMASNLNAAPIALADRSQYLALQLPRTVASISDLRSSSPPAGNIFILMTPEVSGAAVNTFSQFASAINEYNAPIGGLYYFDPAYSALDNGSTCIKPNTTTGAGRWRLQGGPLFQVVELQYDAGNGNDGSTVGYTAVPPSIATATQFHRGPAPTTFIYTRTAGTTSSISPGFAYVNDIVDMSFTTLINTGTGATGLDLYWDYNAGGANLGGQPNISLPANIIVTMEVKARYMVTAADITAGTFTLAPTIANISGATGTVCTLLNSYFTVRRP